MKKPIQFDYKGDCVPKARPRVRVDDKGRPRLYTPESTAGFESAITAEAIQAMRSKTHDGPVKLWAHFRIRIPKSYSKRKCEALDGKPHTLKGRMDGDNLVKGIMDACTGVVYEDDGQVYSMCVIKTWSADDPGCFVEFQLEASE